MKVFVLCVEILQDKRLKTIDYKPFLIKEAFYPCCLYSVLVSGYWLLRRRNINRIGKWTNTRFTVMLKVSGFRGSNLRRSARQSRSNKNAGTDWATRSRDHVTLQESAICRAMTIVRAAWSGRTCSLWPAEQICILDRRVTIHTSVTCQLRSLSNLTTFSSCSMSHIPLTRCSRRGGLIVHVMCCCTMPDNQITSNRFLTQKDQKRH